MRELGSQVGRFLLLGAANTLITGTLMALLTTIVDARLAYTVAFSLGLAMAAALTSRVVFRTRNRAPRVVAFVGWYLLVYLVGLLVVRFLDAGLGLDPAPLAGGTIAVTASLGFLGSRRILHQPERPPTGVET